MLANVPLTRFSQRGPRLESIWEGLHKVWLSRGVVHWSYQNKSTTSSFQIPAVWKTSSLGCHSVSLNLTNFTSNQISSSLFLFKNLELELDHKLGILIWSVFPPDYSISCHISKLKNLNTTSPPSYFYFLPKSRLHETLAFTPLLSTLTATIKVHICIILHMTAAITFQLDFL